MYKSALALITVGFTLFNSSVSKAEFWDQPDYIQNKKIYDQVSNVIDMLYSETMDENLKTVTLASEDRDLVKLLTALKNENEKRLWEIFRSEGNLSDEKIAELMSERSTIQALKVTLENDFLAGTDRFYTSGTKIDLSFNNKKFEEFFKKLGYSHTDFFFMCKQEMYNHENRNEQNAGRIPDEAGPAGILYCSGGANAYKTNKEKTRFKSLERFELSMGSIGRSSLAEQTQNGFHALIGDKAVNWDYQISDKFYFQVGFQKYKKVAEGSIYGDSRPEYQVIINGGGQAGTYTNYANLGIIFNYRLLGSLIDMYVSQQTPPSKLERLAALNPQARVKELICQRDWSANLYFGANAKYVFNNNRIDGTSYNVRSNDFVVDLKAGSVIRYKEVYLEAGWVRTSPKWESTVDGSAQPPHTYGHLTASMSYNGYKNLGKKLIAPVKWIVSKDYRKRLQEEQALKSKIRKEGVTIVLDKNDPNSTVNITCD